MEIKKGIGVSPGVVISTAVVLDAEDVVVPKRQVDASQVGEEVKRLAEGIEAAADELKALRQDVTAKHGKDIGDIFGFHLNLLKDKGILKQFNDETKKDAGMIIPVIITIYKDRTFTLQYKSPPASVLLKKAAKLATAAKTPGSETAGTVTRSQVREIAVIKQKDLNSNSVEAAMRMVEGTARSCGIKVTD